IWVWRERLVSPVERSTPIDDFTHLAFGLGEHLLTHEVVVDSRHAPYHGLDGPVGHGIVVQLRWCALRSRTCLHLSAHRLTPSSLPSPHETAVHAPCGGVGLWSPISGLPERRSMIARDPPPVLALAPTPGAS